MGTLIAVQSGRYLGRGHEFRPRRYSAQPASADEARGVSPQILVPVGAPHRIR
jgi:hypothetical protein